MRRHACLALKTLGAEVTLARAFVGRARGAVGSEELEALAQALVDVLEADKEFSPAMLALSAMFMVQSQDQKARNMLKRVVKMPFAFDQAEAFEGAYLALASHYIDKAKFDLAQVCVCVCVRAGVQRPHIGCLLGRVSAYLCDKGMKPFLERFVLTRCVCVCVCVMLRARHPRFPSPFNLAPNQDLCKRCLAYNKSCARAHETLGSILEREAAYKDAADCYEKAWRFTYMGSPSVGYLLAFNYLKVQRLAVGGRGVLSTG